MNTLADSLALVSDIDYVLRDISYRLIYIHTDTQERSLYGTDPTSRPVAVDATRHYQRGP